MALIAAIDHKTETKFSYLRWRCRKHCGWDSRGDWLQWVWLHGIIKPLFHRIKTHFMAHVRNKYSARGIQIDSLTHLVYSDKNSVYLKLQYMYISESNNSLKVARISSGCDPYSNWRGGGEACINSNPSQLLQCLSKSHKLCNKIWSFSRIPNTSKHPFLVLEDDRNPGLNTLDTWWR